MKVKEFEITARQIKMLEYALLYTHNWSQHFAEYYKKEEVIELSDKIASLPRDES
jgi:hypothetical protein